MSTAQELSRHYLAMVKEGLLTGDPARDAVTIADAYQAVRDEAVRGLVVAATCALAALTRLEPQSANVFILREALESMKKHRMEGGPRA